MYGYGSSGFSSVQSNALLASFGIYMVLGFIAFVAAIVVTVLLYKKFVSDGTPQVSGKRDWRPFFRFETLLIDKILKALYIFVSCLIAFESAAAIIAGLCSIIADPFGALLGIIFIAILCVVFEILNRLGFEQTMLMILVWRNTSDLRKGLVGDVSYGNAPSNPAAPAGGAAPAQPVAPAAAAAPSNAAPTAAGAAGHPAASPAAGNSAAQTAPYAPVASQPSGWTCPSCGTSNKAGSFCAQCGKKKPE